MDQFQGLGLAEPILKALAVEGYTIPTPIQAALIPVMMSGQDVVGIAQTGTGKTASFVLPLLNQIAAARRHADGAPAPKTCGALILAPTRELVAQIAENIRNYSRFMRVSVVVIVGGVKPGAQVRALASGADIVVATPGRLLDHLTNGAVRLDATRAVILDEADQMLDLGFMPSIRKIMSKLPKKRQTALMSATMPSQIRSLANDFLNNPKQIAVAAVSRPVERIDQRVVHAAAGAKKELLLGLLRGTDVERAIVFTRTKRGADRVSQFLQNGGLSSAAIHGNKSQGQRERALAAFRDGQVSILVATDIAARGIDIDDVSHVVNYELPNVPEAYVHRIGRTARAGRTGVAVSLCDAAELGLLRDIEKLIGNRLPREGEPVAVVPSADVPAKAKPKARGAGRNAGRPARAHAQASSERAPDRPQGQRRRAKKPRVATGDGASMDTPKTHKPARAGQTRNGNRTERSGAERPAADRAKEGRQGARSPKRNAPSGERGRSRSKPHSGNKKFVAG